LVFDPDDHYRYGRNPGDNLYASDDRWY